MSIEPSYRGSLWNFPITFPGFIVFACAWNGYVYNIYVDTVVYVEPLDAAQAELTKTGGGRLESARLDLKMPFRVKHCSWGRGFWSGMGWFTWGGTSLVGGAVFTGYDDKISDPFKEAIKGRYGGYVAEKTVQALRDSNAEEYIRLRSEEGSGG